MLFFCHHLTEHILLYTILACLIDFYTSEITKTKDQFTKLKILEPRHYSRLLNQRLFSPSIFRRWPLRPKTRQKKLSGVLSRFFLRPNPVGADKTAFNDSHLAPIRVNLTNTSPPETPKVQNTDEAKKIARSLESALDLPGVRCGTVPIYEKLYNRSINETAESLGSVRILYGLDTKVGEWPWTVRISECEDAGFCVTCTGSLLNDRWFITAGHCAFGKNDTSRFKATLGLYDLVTPEETSFTMDIDKMIVHEDYKDLNNDLCLMRLAQPVRFNENIQPVCLIKPTRDVILWTKGKVCYSVGYGMTIGMLDAFRLQKLKITSREPYECNSNTLGAIQLKPNTVCIGPEHGQIGSSCKGDSGGPDICYDPKQGQWILFGTVSFGPAICDREDDEQWLSVSVDLSNYRSWILQTILQNS